MDYVEANIVVLGTIRNVGENYREFIIPELAVSDAGQRCLFYKY